MDIRSEKKLKEVLSLLENGNPTEAKVILNEMIKYDFDTKELDFTIRCCNFWIDIIADDALINNPFERGEELLTKWKEFIEFVNGWDNFYEPSYYAVCRGIFSLARQCYSSMLSEKDVVQRSEINRKLGLCYKKLGDYENAKQCLVTANSLHPVQSAVIADLADCYALCGEDKEAKVLFREAFYIDFKRIDLEFLDSRLICRLADKVKGLGYGKDEVKAWIPVYGVLWGVFTIKRTMKYQETVKLKQEIYALENELKTPARANNLITPRLINLYFWLIDLYRANNDDKLVLQTLLRIKILAPDIYNLYCR